MSCDKLKEQFLHLTDQSQLQVQVGVGHPGSYRDNGEMTTDCL